MADVRSIAGEIPGNFAQGLGDVLSRHLDAESGAKGDDWQIDIFTNDFEDEFPFDPEAAGSPYPTYGPEANRAADGKPYGGERNNRPKIHELNQPQLAQSRGWRIIDLYPERNTKSEFYRISGTPAEIRLLTQQIRHIREVIKSSVGDFNFEEWFKEWEKGFPSFVNRFHASNTEIKTNYPLADYAGVNGQTIEAWRKDLSTRPTFIKWGESLNNKKYLVIEYFPDRSQPKSILLTGTQGQVIDHIIQYHYEGGSGTEGEYEEKIPTEISTLSNRPYLKLYFRQPVEEVAAGKRAAKMEITINIMDKTDISIDKSDLVALATRIAEQFNVEGNPYKHKKGKNYYTYHDWANGYQLQLLANTESEARQTLLKILAIKQHQLNEKYWKESRAVNVAAAYPNEQENVTIMGKTYKKPLRRPSVNVTFRWARFSLPSIGKHFVLVSNEKSIPVSPEVKAS
ncbi:MAG: hypothetical protein ACRC78_12675 [Planktothrix sp.]